MTEDTDFPRLTPRNDRRQGGGRLFRRPEDLTDDQFDLLAAAWADDALRGDSLAETEEAMTSSPERRVRAESFRRVRLAPLNDRWESRNRMLKVTPGAYAIRRTLIVTLTVAATLGALVILGPLMTRPDTPPAVPPVAEVQTMREALIPGASPVVKPAPGKTVISADRTMNQTDIVASSYTDATGNPGSIIVTEDSREPAVSFTIMHDFAGAVPLLAAAPEASRLAPVELKAVTSLPVAGRGDNWILRGLSLLAEAITKEPKSVDGYFIADACVRGVNRVLGWEMELEQEKNHEGELLATNFSSSLLTFSAPAKKTQP